MIYQNIREVVKRFGVIINIWPPWYVIANDPDIVFQKNPEALLPKHGALKFR